MRSGRTCRHVEKNEKRNMENDGLVLDRIEQILIQDNAVDNSDNDNECSDRESEDQE